MHFATDKMPGTLSFLGSLVVPRHQLSSYGRRAFCVAGPSVWNSLPDNLRKTGYWREQFQTISEDVSVRNVLMHSAH